jgi:hypothetical protein
VLPIWGAGACVLHGLAAAGHHSGDPHPRSTAGALRAGFSRSPGSGTARPRCCPLLPGGHSLASILRTLFVSIKGGAYARFRRALDTRNLMLVRAAAAELPTVNLDDALRICVVPRADPSRYERAVIRWLGRLCLDRAARHNPSPS